ncbi:MAG TPA: beta-propeller domain-containing protein, partial [Ilumatobacteraceae bacterium]
AEDTTVSLYDVADASNPNVVGRWHVEGTLVAARAVDGTARLVLASSFAQRLPFVQPSMFGLDEDLALERNRAVIDGSTVDDWLPRVFTEAADGSFGAMSGAVDCSRVGAPDTFSGLGISWIASVDLHADARPVGSAGVVSSGETVYASPTALYLATMPWDWYHPVDDQQRDDEPPPTQIHAFELDGGTGATYVATGAVPGRLLDQFSMSEHDGVLRVAVTIDATSGTTSSSSVVVLRRDGGTLREISRVDGLGTGEQIYAVRFLGDVGYVVTFRQVDPLYVVDLSDPAHPLLQGELKIPGYSAYLHPIGDGLLLGVGQNATDEGRVLGTQLSLFDVSDPQSPQQVSTLAIGGWSDAEWDHHAFLFWPDDGTVVLPVTPGWQECGPNDTCLADQITGSAGGAIVARVVDRTLVPVGTISHDARNDNCWNPLRRSLVVGDEIVTVGPDQMVFSARSDLAPRAAVTWGTPDEYGCWGYWQE